MQDKIDSFPATNPAPLHLASHQQCSANYLSLRQLRALSAVQGLLASPTGFGSIEEIVKTAYEVADAIDAFEDAERYVEQHKTFEQDSPIMEFQPATETAEDDATTAFDSEGGEFILGFDPGVEVPSPLRDPHTLDWDQVEGVSANVESEAKA